MPGPCTLHPDLVDLLGQHDAIELSGWLAMEELDHALKIGIIFDTAEEFSDSLPAELRLCATQASVLWHACGKVGPAFEAPMDQVHLESVVWWLPGDSRSSAEFHASAPRSCI